jgi:alkanesulfonate monooxygenase
MAIIARHTREEAVETAHSLVNRLDPLVREKHREQQFVMHSDSISIKRTYEAAARSEWPKPYLWMGAVSTHGPATVCLVGSAEEVADAIMEYKMIGVSQFIFSGWPKLEEMAFFGKYVLPLIREKERELPAHARTVKMA